MVIWTAMPQMVMPLSAEKVLPGMVTEALPARIARTTELAIEFNDAVEAGKGTGLNYALVKMLSELGEEIATRIDLEDQLIAAMLKPR